MGLISRTNGAETTERSFADSYTIYGPLAGRAQNSPERTFHWPLEFPDVMAAGGFDVVLGNPPWERIKLQEQEFFASRDPEIAEAPNAAARGRLIAKLKSAEPGTRERLLHEEFEVTKRAAEASSVFARIDGEEGGRFPITGRGDVNTYALFAELFSALASPRGRAGVISFIRKKFRIQSEKPTCVSCLTWVRGGRCRLLADCVAKVPKRCAPNFPLKDEPSDDRRSMYPQARQRSCQ